MSVYGLTPQERITLDRAVARAMTGKSVLHPKGRVPIPITYRETLVLPGSPLTYPRDAHWVIPAHRLRSDP